MNVKLIGTLIAGVAVLAIGYTLISGNSEKEAMMMKEGEAIKDDKMVDKKMDDKMMKDEKAMEAKGVYAPYEASKIAMANNSKVVLFFHAAWCPTCRAAEKEILEVGVNNGVIILKVDYDSAKDLKAKYGVTTQHTFVQIDATGNVKTKWSGGDLANLYSKLK
jgi:thioredoxin 1